jgi:hypothetical protein
MVRRDKKYSCSGLSGFFHVSPYQGADFWSNSWVERNNYSPKQRMPNQGMARKKSYLKPIS